MNYEVFKKNLMAAVEAELESQGIEGITLKNEEIMSPDGMTDRLIVGIPGSNISMAYRLQEIYNDYDGDIESKAENLVESIKENLKVKEKEADVKSFITDFDQAKENLMFRLIPGDSPVLKEAPYKSFTDKMALVVNLQLDSFSDDHGRACVMVDNALMDIYGVSKDELFEIAQENSLKKEPIKINTLNSMVAMMMNDPEYEAPANAPTVLVVSNESGFHGAAVIGYPDTLDQIKEKVGGDFYLIPSSVHEFLIMKDDGTINPNTLNSMVRDVNTNVLNPRDILADECFHYDSKNQLLETGLDYKERATNIDVEEDIDEDLDEDCDI